MSETITGEQHRAQAGQIALGKEHDMEPVSNPTLPEYS